MLLSEARKEFKKIGYKLKIKSMSIGRHADVLNADGVKMPTLFYDREERAKWLPAIELKQAVSPVFDDNTSDKIYGFSS